MKTKTVYLVFLFVLLSGMLSACGTQTKLVAPEIEPPTDLIPSYVPEGYKLISGFQLSGEINLPEFDDRNDDSPFGRLWSADLLFQEKSPAGNVIQGVYYQDKENLILITKSYYPEADLDDWMDAYNAAGPQPCECDCECINILRLDALGFPSRFVEYQEERTINDTRVAILIGPLGWLTIFVRGDYLLGVESKISLEENLKIVESLLEN